MKQLFSTNTLLFAGMSLMALWCTACNKQDMPKPASYVSVRFIEDEYPVAMQYITGSYDTQTGQATLDAQGYHFEYFHLSLPGVFKTGDFPNPTIRNLSYSVTTDNYDFDADSVINGSISIDHINGKSLGGSFRATLSSTFNGSQTRIITGSFEINSP